MEDYAGILRRRFGLIVISSIALLIAGDGISYVLPPQYMSQTLILIEQQTVPADYVKPVVEEDLGSRLASMKEQILSRSRIQPIIERFNLYSGTKTTMDDRIAMTQKSIGIKPIQSNQYHNMPGFFISFKAQDARTAQQVCGEITSLFTSENLNERQQSAEGTTDFLKQQLADAKRSLDDQDAKLAAFEQKNIGKLPGQSISLGGSNIVMGSPTESTLQALTTQLDAVTQQLGRSQQDVTFLQALIAQQTHELQRITDPGAGVSVDERRAELKRLIAQKQELDATYKPDYPDVISINRKIADLQAEIAHAPTEAAPKAATAAATHVDDTPQMLSLKAQLRSAQLAMENGKAEQARLQAEVRTYEERIEASPLVEEEYKQITRDHETALQFYNTLLTKMNESSMATALEQRNQGEQFRVMDAPNLPDSPSFPNRLVFAGGGLAAGFVLGLLISALLEYRDTSLRNERDIWAFTKLPTMAIISHIGGLPQTSKSHSRWNPFSRSQKPVENAGD
jgi:polysaccharide chain length determinant protein (PEP-CTERM system associated)